MKKIFLTLLLAIAGMSWITAEEPVATIAENGIQFETVQLENGKAKVAVECLVHSKRAKGISLQLEVFYDNTRLYFRNRPYKQGEAIAFNVNLKNVHAWTPEYPNLYRAEFSLWLEEEEIGHRTVFFPVRTVEFADQTCILNGKKLNLHGVRMQEQEPFAPTNPKDAIRYRLKWLRPIGCNAIGCSAESNPSLPDICDQLGFILITASDPAAAPLLRTFVDEPLEYGYQPTLAYYKYLKQWKKKDAACLVTSDDPSHLELLPEYVGDLTYVHIRLLASNNYLCNKATNVVSVELDGAGELLGVVSGSEIIKADGNKMQYKPTDGILTAVVRGNGNLSARSEDLVGALLQINHNK